MKLFFIANSRIPTERAMGTAIMKQCEAFAHVGFEVELIVPKRHNEHTENPFVYHDVEENFSIRYLNSLDLSFLKKNNIRFLLQKFSFFLALNIYLLKAKTGVLYGREPELIGPLLTKKAKFVELHHLYGLGYFGKRSLKPFMGIISITKALKEDVVRVYSYPSEAILVAPSGVNLRAFEHVASKPEIQNKLGIITNLPIALYVGALEKWKGYITFLEASKYLRGLVQMVVMGGTDEQVAQLSQKYTDVQFLGFLSQNELQNNQQVADVLVVPNSGREIISARHTSPLKLFAHMVSNIPIVASSIPSIIEILSEKNAILVNPDDAKALAEGILYALNEKANSATIAKQAQKDVQKYDWSVRTTTIITFINESSSKTHV